MSAEATSRDVRLAGLAYELGETAPAIETLPNWSSASRTFPRVDDRAMWGFGCFRRTDRSPAALALATAKRSLASAALRPDDIDTVLLCSVSFMEGAPSHLALVNELLGELNLLHAFYLGLTLGRCATLIGALRTAALFVASGRAQNVLVVSTDVMAAEDARLQPFGVFSDAASSCVVTDGRGDYTLLRAQGGAERVGMGDSGGRLAERVHARLFADAPCAPADVAQVFVDNLFRPLVCMREQLGGFHKGQLYLENIARLGHCAASDPLINLADYAAQRGPRPGAHYVLAAGTPGLRHALLVRDGL